jgi:hypothetical protein
LHRPVQKLRTKTPVEKIAKSATVHLPSRVIQAGKVPVKTDLKTRREPVARKRVKRIFPIALSAAHAAEAMDIPLSHIARAVRSGALIARQGPGRRERITVADLMDWWHRDHPRAMKQRGTP